MEIQFKVVGILLISLSLIHIIFPKYFNWNEELKSLSLINRQIMIVHTFFIAFIVFLIGLLCLISTTDLVGTRLGKTITLGIGILWTVRLFFQQFVYSSELWKGKIFETIIHILFLLFWTYLSIVFLYSALS